jgi:hypothetical protein
MRRDISSDFTVAQAVSPATRSQIFWPQSPPKLAVLRTELDHADEQIALGKFTEYNEHTIGELSKEVHARGLRQLATLKTRTK